MHPFPLATYWGKFEQVPGEEVEAQVPGEEVAQLSPACCSLWRGKAQEKKLVVSRFLLHRNKYIQIGIWIVQDFVVVEILLLSCLEVSCKSINMADYHCM